MVRAKGLEPPHLAILVPKTSASTNSATHAAVSGRVHEIARCRARPCGPRGAIADAWPRARGQSLIIRGWNMRRARSLTIQGDRPRWEEHTSELQSLRSPSYPA